MLGGNQALMLGDKPSCFTGSTKEMAHTQKRKAPEEERGMN